MTQTSAPPPPPQPAPKLDNTRWTGAKAGAFLKLLARSGKVAPCARAVGMSARSAYRLRARAPEFAKLWEMAMGEAARRKASSRGSSGRPKAVHPLLAKTPLAGIDGAKGSHSPGQRVAP